MLKPQAPAPPLDVELVGGGRWNLADQQPDAFSMLVFYRGLHCPVCSGYAKQLDSMLEDFAAVGVTSVIAISGDTAKRAQRSVEEWRIEHLSVGYGQTVDSMREWGLFVSKGIKEGEPALFGEPGLFLIRPDGNVYAEVLNSMPFARPRFDELLGSIAWVNEHDYPARGEA
ncbi:MAG TPA: redoxin domain-containing protein [Acidimicrobiales bacterium]|nr:redoxin domain-containing protein [Acidimicrobiales bacterium]